MLVLLGGVAKIYPNLSDGAKKYQQAFLVLLPGLDSISILGDCAKKCQHIPRGPPNEDWARAAPPGCDRTVGAPAPLRACFGPIFRGLPLTDVAKVVVRVWSKFNLPTEVGLLTYGGNILG